MTAPHTPPAALVAGAGPSGLMMAAELARHGVPCRIIDKLPHSSTTSKALALHARTLEVFEQISIVEEALNHGLKLRGMSIYAAGRRIIHISFDDLHAPYPFILSLPQSETERILGTHLERLGIQVEREVELVNAAQDEQTVTATLRHADGREETVTTSWLIGCDGAHSAARHSLNVPFTGAPYPEAFALADVHVEWPLPDDEAYIFLQDGLLAVFPMRGGRYRLIVETATDAGDEEMPDPTLEEIQGYLNTFAPAGSVASDPAWLSAFRIHLRHAEQTRQGRVFLVGDAAHIHSPAGGQGMNTGLQDAYNLAWKLALVNAGQAPASLLDTYQIERQPVAESVLRMSDLLIKGAMLRGPISQQIRNRLVPLLVEQDFIQQRITTQMAELSINYRKSPIVAEHHSGRFSRGHLIGGLRAGDRAPAAEPLLLADGTNTRLFEVLRGTRHTLLLLADAESDNAAFQRLATLAAEISARYGRQINPYLIVAGDKAPSGIASSTFLLLDPELALHQRYGAASECLYLIRPDGYIAFRSYPADAESLHTYLQALF